MFILATFLLGQNFDWKIAYAYAYAYAYDYVCAAFKTHELI
jgi:hypothetical protein